MAGETSTRLMTGALPLVILLAALLAAPVCALLLRWYRKTLTKGMARTIGREIVAHEPPPGAPPLNRLEIVEAGSVRSSLAAKAVSRLNKMALIYTIAGVSFAWVLGTAYIAAARPEVVRTTSIAPFAVVFAWPAVLALSVIYPPSWKLRWFGALAYSLVLMYAVNLPAFDDPAAKKGLLLYAAMVNVPFTLLALVLLHRRIRSVGPMVFALMMLCLVGATIAVESVDRSDRLLYGIITVADAFGLGAYTALIFILLTGAGAFFMIGWVVLRMIEKLYSRGAIGDLSLVIDSVWFLYGVFISIMLSFNGPIWLLTFVPALAIYKIVLRAGQILSRGKSARVPVLVQLRVFALGDDSARLFEVVARYWRQVGAIRLIAGPDLANTTVEPHEFLSFLSFRFGNQFVDKPESVTLTDSTASDPDGRYRIREFFCRADTWKPVLSRLVSHGDPVLMDLRKFSPDNAGCVHELRELMNTASFERIVLVTDEGTHVDYLRTVLTDAWRNSRPDSPNRLAAVCRVQLCTIRAITGREARRLLNHICAAAEHQLTATATQG
jgi:hypothetical protein